MKYVVLLAALFCTTLGAIRKAPPSAFEKATAEIQALAAVSCSDFNIFAQHLPYYRSWRNWIGFQSVTPPPYSLEQRLTAAVEELEQKIKAIVQEEKSFQTQTQDNQLGGSKLSDAGHQFFAQLIDYMQKQPCPPQQAPLRRRKS